MSEVLHELIDAVATVGRLGEDWRAGMHAKVEPAPEMVPEQPEVAEEVPATVPDVPTAAWAHDAPAEP